MSHEGYRYRRSPPQPRGEFVKRFEARVADIARDYRAGRRMPYVTLCKHLTKELSDETNLFEALKYVESAWGTAVGEDGVRPFDMATPQQWAFARATRNRLRKRRYVQGPLKAAEIRKRPGSQETRIVHISTCRDRMIGRALVQLLTPILQLWSDEYSFARPQLGPHRAISVASYHAVHMHRTHWIVEDLSDAYGCVPRQKLFEILHKLVPAHKVCNIAIELAKAPGDRGILQGAAISPWLLNVYLDRTLHVPWRKRFPNTPLLRYADDLVVACLPDEDVGAKYQFLSQLAVSAGFKLKHGPEKAIHDVSLREANWLGYLLRRVDGRMSIRPAKYCSEDSSVTAANLEELRDGFLELHDQPHGCLRVLDKVVGHADYLGPCFEDCDRSAISRMFLRAAEEADFDVLGGIDRFEHEWAAAHQQFAQLAATFTDELAAGRETVPTPSVEPETSELANPQMIAPLAATQDSSNGLVPWCEDINATA
jgi:hypothetical protein